MCASNCSRAVLALAAFVVVVSAAGPLWAGCGSCGPSACSKPCPVKDKAACSGAVCPVTGAKAGPSMEEHGATVASLNPAGLKALLDAKVPLVLLDARSGKWDDGERIPGAKSLHAGSPDKDWKRLLKNKGALVVTYCASPSCSASHQLVEKLHEKGFKNVVELPDGIKGWKEAGYPIVKAK